MSVALIAELNVQPDKSETFEAVFAKMQAAVKTNEPDCLLYTLCRDTKQPGRYFVQEQYRDEAALKLHGQSDAFKAAAAELGPVMAGAPVIHVCDIVG